MERKAVSQYSRRPFSVPQLSIREALAILAFLDPESDPSKPTIVGGLEPVGMSGDTRSDEKLASLGNQLMTPRR